MSTAVVRIIAATNRDLRERMATGAFLEDLYHRLYAEARLQVRRRRRKKVPQADRQPFVTPGGRRLQPLPRW